MANPLTTNESFQGGPRFFVRVMGPKQCCQVRDFIPRSRDFLNQLGCFWDFYFKNSISGFLRDFSELQVLNLVIKFLVKLAS